ncbi:hypothetical protein [Streptomyces sp. NPDC002952]|uniref:hypothetical protein n=1 Tax=Streptomyces sp. NPDC002952 TaxID=3364673 RepID=UPI003688AA4C
MVVGLEAVTRHLLTLCTTAPEGQGPLVNIRADHFEKSVQKLINDWPWKPPPHAAAEGLEPSPHGRNHLTDKPPSSCCRSW